MSSFMKKMSKHLGMAEPLKLPFLRNGVQPVLNVQEFMEDTGLTGTTVSISGTGTATVFTVPDGCVLDLKGLKVSLNTGTYTFSSIAVQLGDVSTMIDLVARIDSTKTTYAAILPQTIRMKAGDKINAYVDTYSGSGNLGCNVIGTLRRVI